MNEDAVDELLRHRIRKPAERLEPAQDEPGVEGQKLEPAVDPVGRLKRLIKRRAAGGGHDLAKNLLDDGSAGAPRAPPGEDHADPLAWASEFGLAARALLCQGGMS
jgi:hypothetical protein